MFDVFAGDFVEVSQKRAVFRSDDLVGEKDVGKRVFVSISEGLEIEEKRLKFRF